jgi:hypothetical protein
MKFVLPLLLFATLTYSQQLVQFLPMSVDSLGIEVKGTSREIAYTNKQAGVFYTETNANHRNAWQGWRIMSHEVMEDYVIEIDGVELRRSDVVRAVVYPHHLVREYANGLKETITLLDSANILTVELENVTGKSVVVRPLFSDSKNKDDYVTKSEWGILVIGRKDQERPTPDTPYPRWIAVSMWPGKNFAISYYEPKSVGSYFSPAGLQGSVRDKNYIVAFAAGDTAKEAFHVAYNIFDTYTNEVASRKERIERMLNRSPVTTDSPRFNLALNWAKVSMDALIMNQGKKGIFAGLPWFDNYWGRDSYISLPGATLVTGNFSDAKEILRSFAEWQDTNALSQNYGRIPNLVTTNSISYNTADGTPRFVMALAEYVKYSGDTSFARMMVPVVKRSIEGTLKYHTDSLSFLTHGDAETWMDAVGPNGAWSARGNRANDIQALWYQQLNAGASLVSDPVLSKRWREVAHTQATNFNTHFVDNSTLLLYDHLNQDGTADHQLRPNQLFDMPIITNPAVAQKMFATVTNKLVYPHGIASLSQEDANFHPFHHHAPNYVQDAAYHNGIIWTWLAGTWIDLATQYGFADTAFRVTKNMVHQILDRGAVGTLSELLDAAPREGEAEPRLSGAYSQAWSNAEFIRNFYQSYLGVTLDDSGGRAVPLLVLSPHVPSAISNIAATIPIASYELHVEFHRVNGKSELTISSPPNAPTLEYRFNGTRLHNSYLVQRGSILPNSRLVLAVDETQKEADVAGEANSRMYSPQAFGGLKLATPVVRAELPSLRKPDHPLMKNDEIKHTNVNAKILYDCSDPEGDDKGPDSTYTYPLTTNLKPGALDITHFTVATDKDNAYFTMTFRDLSNPGWHPEYGFQLTYAAIAIDKDHKLGSGQIRVGMNADYSLPKDLAYENIIYVGGGIQVQDAKGKILSEYIPIEGDEKNPLGDVQSKTIKFSLPVNILGTPNPSWRYVVLVGAQDDHGGAGLGEFRTVEVEAKEWSGGGKNNPNLPNVYDVILPQRKP